MLCLDGACMRHTPLPLSDCVQEFREAPAGTGAFDLSGAVVLGALWAWELVASRQRAKAMRNVQDWSLSSHTSNLSRPDASSQAMELAAKANSDILSWITRPAVHRQGF